MICSALRCGLSAVVWASVTAKASKPLAAALRNVAESLRDNPDS